MSYNKPRFIHNSNLKAFVDPDQLASEKPADQDRQSFPLSLYL